MVDKFLSDIKVPFQGDLDPDFIPAILFHKSYQNLCEKHPTLPLHFALKRSEDNVRVLSFSVLEDPSFFDVTEKYIHFNLKFLLWSVGGYHLSVASSNQWFSNIASQFSSTGLFAFDVNFMSRIYERPWQVEACAIDELPKAKQASKKMGGHFDGCRIGFDLGASDYKLAAVKDGEAVFTTEIRWDPVTQSNPEYHWNHIVSGLELAASHLPRVDCIGGSSAGIIEDNKIMVASLFRSVPDDQFKAKVTPLFNRLKEKWGVPFVTANDGDVSALAGALSTKDQSILGLAMGSSEAVGYLGANGEITGQLNELAFAGVDYNPHASQDEWSQAPGVGVMYFSQQAVNRLALKIGIEFPVDMLLPERLKVVQALVEKGDKQALKIFHTIGVYLGYTIPLYADFYEIKTLMVFGRVVSGLGGDKIIAVAKEVLKQEFPEHYRSLVLATPDEKFRRVGQAVAAASLPARRI